MLWIFCTFLLAVRVYLHCLILSASPPAEETDLCLHLSVHSISEWEAASVSGYIPAHIHITNSTQIYPDWVLTVFGASLHDIEDKKISELSHILCHKIMLQVCKMDWIYIKKNKTTKRTNMDVSCLHQLWHTSIKTIKTKHNLKWPKFSILSSFTRPPYFLGELLL